MAEVPKARRPERGTKQKKKTVTKRPREEDYYPEMPGDGTSLNDNCLSQWVEQTLCQNEVDDPMHWNSLIGAIVRHREGKDDRWAFYLRCHFAIVNTTAQRVAGAGEQGTHWIVVAFDGRLLDTPAFTVYACNLMDTDRVLRPFLRSCHENNIKVPHTILGNQKDGWTCGYRALVFVGILARTDRHVDLGAITLPLMEHRFVEEVQLGLKDMVVREQEVIDQEIQDIAGSLSSVSK